MSVSAIRTEPAYNPTETMSDSIPEHSPDKLRTFGKLLRFLRIRAGLTQTELSIAVGCSDLSRPKSTSATDRDRQRRAGSGTE
jgi:hypothetical protein